LRERLHDAEACTGKLVDMLRRRTGKWTRFL